LAFAACESAFATFLLLGEAGISPSFNVVGALAPGTSLEGIEILACQILHRGKF
jgi:hypothetical protein